MLAKPEEAGDVTFAALLDALDHRAVVHELHVALAIARVDLGLGEMGGDIVERGRLELGGEADVAEHEFGVALVEMDDVDVFVDRV